MSAAGTTLTAAQKAMLPKDKHDEAAVAHIATLPESSIEPLIPQLLSWLEDTNWPVARPILTFLLKYPHLLVEPVRKVLHGDDDDWKWTCLEHIVAVIPPEQQQALCPELERIAKSPTAREKESESDEVARDILDNLEGIKRS